MSGKNTHRGWLKNPTLARDGETIGGGFFIFRRGDGTKRIRPSQWPFEYATYEAAVEQALILASGNPGYSFDVVGVVYSAFVPAQVEALPPAEEQQAEAA